MILLASRGHDLAPLYCLCIYSGDSQYLRLSFCIIHSFIPSILQPHSFYSYSASRKLAIFGGLSISYLPHTMLSTLVQSIIFLGALQQAHGLPEARRGRGWGSHSSVSAQDSVQETTAVEVQNPASTASNFVPSSVAPAAGQVSSFTNEVEPPVVQTTAAVAPVQEAVDPVVASTTLVSPDVSPAQSASVPAASSDSKDTTGNATTSGADGSGLSYTGEITYYDTGVGACGISSAGTEAVAAVSMLLYDQYVPGGNPNACTLCGKYITIQTKSQGPYKVKIVDRCVGCKINDIDLSRTAFDFATDKADGRAYDMTWTID